MGVLFSKPKEPENRINRSDSQTSLLTIQRDNYLSTANHAIVPIPPAPIPEHTSFLIHDILKIIIEFSVSSLPDFNTARLITRVFSNAANELFNVFINSRDIRLFLLAAPRGTQSKYIRAIPSDAIKKGEVICNPLYNVNNYEISPLLKFFSSSLFEDLLFKNERSVTPGLKETLLQIEKNIGQCHPSLMVRLLCSIQLQYTGPALLLGLITFLFAVSCYLIFLLTKITLPTTVEIANSGFFVLLNCQSILNSAKILACYLSNISGCANLTSFNNFSQLMMQAGLHNHTGLIENLCKVAAANNPQRINYNDAETFILKNCSAIGGPTIISMKVCDLPEFHCGIKALDYTRNLPETQYTTTCPRAEHDVFFNIISLAMVELGLLTCITISIKKLHLYFKQNFHADSVVIPTNTSTFAENVMGGIRYIKNRFFEKEEKESSEKCEPMPQREPHANA